MINDLKGGVGDNSVPEHVNPNELSIGIQIEMEHTNNPSIAKEIAMDHLTEDPEYYTKLVKAGLAKEFQPAVNSGFGDPDLAINDKSRAGDHGNKSGNVIGTIGNTSDGQVNGRNSDPIINKTVDIELQEKKKKKSKPKPTNSSLWSRAKAMARAKFDVYPSAYANAWAAKWYKKKGGGWRMSEDQDPNKNPLNVFDGPTPAEVSPDGLGTYGSGYDFVGYAENKDTIMKEQKLKEIIKNIIRKQLNEQDETPTTSDSGKDSSNDSKASSDTSSDAGSSDAENTPVTVTLDHDMAQKLHDLLMQQLSSDKSSTDTSTSDSSQQQPAAEEQPAAQPQTSDIQKPADTNNQTVSEETDLMERKRKKKWIQKAVSKPGALHKQLGVPAGEKIPAEKLKSAAEKGGKLGKRARLAMTLSKISKKKKK